MDCVRSNAIFQALDGQRISVATKDWLVEIYGVFEQDEACWVQLDLRGTPDYSLALRIGPVDTERQLLNHLSSWLRDPARLDAHVLSFA